MYHKDTINKASPFKTAKFKSHAHDRQHSRSPNRSFTSKSNNNSSSVSLRSEHIWNSLEQVQIFPEYYVQLLRNQDRNINWFKSQINKQKERLSLQLQAFTVQIMHMLEDYKLSLIAILDRIYQNYISRYAQFKSQILEINRIQDQILMQVNVKEDKSISPSRNNKISNDYAVKSMESNLNQLKKFKIMNYISELQKEKAIPLAEKAQYIVVLTEYENGYFQYDQYKEIINNSKSKFKGEFRDLIENVYTYIRNPDSIAAKQTSASKNRQRQNPILREVTDPQIYHPPVNMRKNNSEMNFGNAQTKKYEYQVNQMDNFIPDFPDDYSVNRNDADSVNFGNIRQPPPNRPGPQNFHHPHAYPHSQVIVSSSMNRVSSDLLKLSEKKIFKSVSADIMLCCLWLKDNLIVAGNKDGSLIFYDEKGTVYKSFLKQHKSSVCSLGIINDGQYLASGSDYPNSEIILWNLNTLEPFCSFKEHKAAVTAIACLRDQEHMISGSYDKKLCIYSFHDKKMKYTLPSNKSSVSAICLNSDGTKMISCGLEDKMLNIWQIVRKDKVQTLFLEQIIQNNAMMCSVVSSAVKSNIVYVGSKDGRIKIVDIEKGQAIKSMNVCNNAIIEIVAYEQQGMPLIIGWPCKQKCLKIIDCESGKITSMPTKGMLEFSCGIGPKATTNSDGSLVIVGSQGQDREVSIYKINRGM